jgi:putative peptide zinc metalloprotease protein
MTFKSVFKKIGAKACKAALDVLQSEGKFNPTKIGLFVLTFALYSVVFNWKFAILLMLAIGLHESGHVWAMRKVGIFTKGFYFIPFFGGVALGENKYKSYADRVIVFIMGPLWGMLMALATLFLYWLTNDPLLGAAAYWQGMLNLFNLLPVNPLDGGRIFNAIFASVHKRIGDIFSVASILALGLLVWKLHAPILILIVVFAIIDFISNKLNAVADDIPKLSFKEVCMTLVIYATVVLMLAGIVAATLVPGKHFSEIFLK